MEANTPNDPVIDEVREVRRRISARFDHDPDRLVAHYLRFQQQFGDRLIGAAALPATVGQPAVEPDDVSSEGVS
ncbi:MAG: hypothetical protein ACRDD1_12270 [Planctomycetia bacterium]